jgi:MtN3 and saliva related transmembrane protein
MEYSGGLDLTASEIVGLVAGVFTTFSLVPQVMRIFKLRSAREISLMYTVMVLVGNALWLAYGIWDKLFPVILWNAISIILISTLLYGKLRHGMERKHPVSNEVISMPLRSIRKGKARSF